MINKLEQLKLILLKLMAIIKGKTLLETFCEAIKMHEGWTPTSRSRRNFNPGNLKYTDLTKSLGAINKDKDNFAIFANYDAGFKALMDFVVLACTNKLKAYKGDMMIFEFFNVYAPSSDNNNPIRYAMVVARYCGISEREFIKNLL